MPAFSKIRIIGNTVLHRIPMAVDWHSSQHISQLKKDISLMNQLLVETRAVGISSNQCLSIKTPLQVILIGSNDEACREWARKNYPERVIPNVTVMVNPRIIKLFGDVFYPQFGESCLSVTGCMAGQVPRFSSVEIKFDDEQGRHHHEIFSGFAAHVIQHECDHQSGVVFLQKIFQKLSSEQKEKFKMDIEKSLITASEEITWDPMPDQRVLFWDAGNSITVDDVNASEILTHTPKEVLEGILKTL